MEATFAMSWTKILTNYKVFDFRGLRCEIAQLLLTPCGFAAAPLRSTTHGNGRRNSASVARCCKWWNTSRSIYIRIPSSVVGVMWFLMWMYTTIVYLRTVSYLITSDHIIISKYQRYMFRIQNQTIMTIFIVLECFRDVHPMLNELSLLPCLAHCQLLSSQGLSWQAPNQTMKIDWWPMTTRNHESWIVMFTISELFDYVIIYINFKVPFNPVARLKRSIVHSSMCQLIKTSRIALMEVGCVFTHGESLISWKFCLPLQVKNLQMHWLYCIALPNDSAKQTT